MPHLPRLAAVVVALAAATLAPTAAARAATPAVVHASPAQVSRLLFVAGDVRRLSRAPSGTVDTVLEQVLQAEYKHDPALSPDAAAGDIAGLRAAVGSGHTATAALAVVPGNQRVLAILAAFEHAQAAPRVKRALAAVADRALTESSSPSFDANSDSRSTLLYGSFAPAATLRATADLAADDPAFGRARDAVWAAASHESVFAGADALVAGNPELQTDAIRSLLAQRSPDGSLMATTDDLEALVRSGLQTVGDQTTTALRDHADVARTCPGQFCDYYTARAQADGQASRTAISAQQASLTAVSMLLAQADADTGRALLAESQGAAQVAGAVNEFYATKDYGDYEKYASDAVGLVIGLAEIEVDPAAAVIGTINVVSDALGGALQLPDANELILQGLHGVSQQLAAFADATAAQFRGVDARLEGLSQQVSDVARDLSTQLAEARMQLSMLGDRISTLQTSVDRLQSEIQLLFNAQAHDALRTTIDQSVGYATRNRGALSPTAFGTAADSLFSDAASLASSPTVADTKDTLDAATAADTTDLNAYLNFFSAFAGGPQDKAGTAWPGALGAHLPNPDYWATAARAYSQLLLENRDDVVAGRLPEFDGIEAQGTALEQALARIGAHDAGDAGTGSRLFNAALDYYSSWVDGDRAGQPSLLGALRANVQRFVSDQTGDPSIDPWGGPGQSLGAVNPSTLSAFKNLHNANPNSAYELSGTALAPALATRLPAQILNAVRLGVGSLRVTWTASFPSSVERGGRGVLTVTFHYVYTDERGKQSTLPDLAFTIADALDCTGPGNDTDGAAVVAASWSVPPTANGCPDVPASTQVAASNIAANVDPAVVSTAGTDVQNQLRALQFDFYDHLLGGPNGTLTGDVADAAKRLDGAQSVIDAYVTLGLPQALATDDALHSLIAGDDADPLSHPFFDARTADPAADVPGQVAAYFRFEQAEMPQSSPFPALETLLNRHRQALQDAIAPYIKTGHGAIDDGALDEANPLVRSTLDRLELTRAVLQDRLDNPPAAPAPQPQPQPAPPAQSSPTPPAPSGPAATVARARVIHPARAAGRTIRLTVGCQTGTCRITVSAASGRRAVARTQRVSLRAGTRRTVVLRLNAAARRLLARRGRLGVTVKVTQAGRPRPLAVTRVTVH